MKTQWRPRALMVLWLGLLALSLTSSALASSALAQEPPELDEEAEEPEPPAPAQRARMLERMRLTRAWKLNEVLELDEATGQRLFKALERFDEPLLEAHHALRKAERDLRRGLRGDATEAQLTAMTDQVLARKRALDELRLKQFEEAGATLDARRRAKLLLFIPRFEQELRRKLHKRRERRDRRK